jgi:hypothetical protein
MFCHKPSCRHCRISAQKCWLTVLSLLHERHTPLALHTRTHLCDHLGHSGAGLSRFTVVPRFFAHDILSNSEQTHSLIFVTFLSICLVDKCYNKSNVDRLHTWRYIGGGRGITPTILNLSTRWRWVVRLMSRSPYPRKRTLVTIE